MRIVVTKNGTKIISELHEVPLKDISHRKNVISFHTLTSSKKSNHKPQRSPSSENNFSTINMTSNNYKSIGVKKPAWHLTREMTEKYINDKRDDSLYYETLSPKDHTPNVLLSISKSYNSSSRLPVIRDSYPLKNILSEASLKKLEKDYSTQEQVIQKQKLTESTFRTQVKESPKLIFNKITSKEIKSHNRNWIEYWNVSDTISNPFIEKLSKCDDARLRSWNKICQKVICNKSQERRLKSDIQKKIRGGIVDENDFCKDRWNSMKSDLIEYDKIVKFEYPKVDKREKYTYQFREAERNWNKYGIERYSKKNSYWWLGTPLKWD